MRNTKIENFSNQKKLEDMFNKKDEQCEMSINCKSKQIN